MTPIVRIILQIVAYLGLALSLVSALLVFGGVISKDTYFSLLALGMVLWFATAASFVKRDHIGE